MYHLSGILLRIKMILEQSWEKGKIRRFQLMYVKGRTHRSRDRTRDKHEMEPGAKRGCLKILDS